MITDESSGIRPATYIRLPTVQEAIQFRGDNQHEVIMFLGGIHAQNHSWLPDPTLGGFLHVPDDQGRRFGPGDWISRDSRGWLSIHSDRAFRGNHDHYHVEVES